MFESLAEYLPSKLMALYSLPYLKDIATRVKQTLGDDAVPMVCFLVDPASICYCNAGLFFSVRHFCQL